MTTQIETKSLKRTNGKIAAAVLIIVALAFGWFAIRWQLGDMLAEMTSSSEPNAREIAQLANGLAPGDPSTSWLIAATEKDVFTPEKIADSLGGYAETVRLAPFDFRWWVELGRANEQADKPEAAEKAYLRAVQLAPEYTYPHWQLGNFYLRQNRADDAFAELRKAAASNTIYRQQIFSIAWDFYDKDTAKLEAITEGLPAARTDLAKFYASRGQAENSLRVWNSLTEEEKQDNAAVARFIAQGLYEQKRYQAAVEFVRQLGIEPDARAASVQNGGFESPIGQADYIYFNWQVSKNVEKMDVKLDPTQKHEGNRSLRVGFNGFAEPQLANIWQTVAVEPNKKYTLSFWLKTEDLKSAGTPTIEIINANDGKLITASKSFPTGTNNWQQLTVEFSTPENAEAVTIRTGRGYCGDRCPIFGVIWYDNFQIGNR